MINSKLQKGPTWPRVAITSCTTTTPRDSPSWTVWISWSQSNRNKSSLTCCHRRGHISNHCNLKLQGTCKSQRKHLNSLLRNKEAERKQARRWLLKVSNSYLSSHQPSKEKSKDSDVSLAKEDLLIRRSTRRTSVRLVTKRTRRFRTSRKKRLSSGAATTQNTKTTTGTTDTSTGTSKQAGRRGSEL